MTVERFPVEKARPSAPPDSTLQHEACKALLLTAGAFTDARYRKVFDALIHLFLRDEHIDLITLTDELRRRNQFESIGAEFIAGLIS